jgi:SAM-dependent methyltransferase
MQSPEQNVADIYGLLRAAPAGGTVDQFRSLPQASQYRNLYALAAKYMQPGARVLDWGCGNGHFSFFLARQGAVVTSYSFDPEPEVFGLLTPQERARISFVRGSTHDPHRLPFGDRSFACLQCRRARTRARDGRHRDRQPARDPARAGAGRPLRLLPPAQPLVAARA